MFTWVRVPRLRHGRGYSGVLLAMSLRRKDVEVVKHAPRKVSDEHGEAICYSCPEGKTGTVVGSTSIGDCVVEEHPLPFKQSVLYNYGIALGVTFFFGVIIVGIIFMVQLKGAGPQPTWA